MNTIFRDFSPSNTALMYGEFDDGNPFVDAADAPLTARNFLDSFRVDAKTARPRLPLQLTDLRVHTARFTPGDTSLRPVAEHFLADAKSYAQSSLEAGQPALFDLPGGTPGSKKNWSFYYTTTTFDLKYRDNRAVMTAIFKDGKLPEDWSPTTSLDTPRDKGSPLFLFRRGLYERAPFVSVQKETDDDNSPIEIALGYGDYGNLVSQRLFVGEDDLIRTDYEINLHGFPRQMMNILDVPFHRRKLARLYREENVHTIFLEIGLRICAGLKNLGFDNFAMKKAGPPEPGHEPWASVKWSDLIYNRGQFTTTDEDGWRSALVFRGENDDWKIEISFGPGLETGDEGNQLIIKFRDKKPGRDIKALPETLYQRFWVPVDREMRQLDAG